MIRYEVVREFRNPGAVQLRLETGTVELKSGELKSGELIRVPCSFS